jgi:4'-phosphopantetheinyl transferase
MLEDDEVHVWEAGLDSAETCLQDLEALLSGDELERARRFHFATDRDRFVSCRGILRILLGKYLLCHPSRLNFRYTPHGKPFLETEERLQFNLSHSQGMSVMAFSLKREIGVDVEYIRQDLEIETLASRFFSKNEATKLLNLPIPLRYQAFFRCWTRKEAYIKARGEGMSIALDQFEVSLLPDETPALLSVAGNADEVSRWSLREIVSGPDCLAALAVQGHSWNLRCFEWSW